MQKLILLTILCLNLIQTSQHLSKSKLVSEQEFSSFTKQHRKFYFNQEEYNSRRKIYSETLAAIENHNSNPNQTSKMAVNRFSDLSSDQIHRMYTGIDTEQLLMRKVAPYKNYASFNLQDTPDQVDWTKKGAVTSIKNQGNCGSCWAFSAAGSLQGAYFLKRGELKNFSEQQLVDCTYKSYKNYGCAGGMVDNSFDYFEDYQYESYFDYPYEGVDDSCRDDWSKGVGYVSNYHYVKEMSKEDLMAAIAKQPVSVHVQADQKVFSSYSSGIITSSDCGRNLDHAVLAVGYNKAENYFLIKNSWGPDWGENGFVRIGMDNVCGVLEMSLFPEV